MESRKTPATVAADSVEQRAREVSWDALKGGVDIGTTSYVNPRMAENLSTVLACVGAISSAMASLPAFVYRRLERGREIDERHPIARLIAYGPNQHQTWSDWVEWVMASVLLRGNALAEIIADSRGAVTELRPIPWEHVNVVLLPSGRLAYDITETVNLYGGTSRPRRLLQDEVFHLRDRSDDGLVGKSRLTRAAAVVSTSYSQQTFADSMFKNGVTPSGAIEVEQKLTAEQREVLRENFRQMHAGPSNAAKALLLEGGAKWSKLSLSLEDAEFLASRRFTVEELARLFGCPPPIIGDLTHGTFTNTETMVRFFATNTLTPWVRKVESEFGRSVFSEAARTTHKLELDLSGLLRGDPAQRWAAWKIAREADILTADEIREEEGFNPRGERAAA
ncbi:MAG: phage portal protein [Betaproteobacteria bacterium RIFCSPLOWO2_12_FULL_65_14]|nr:MAG: phage portal protein [Betaproteobacteria bacterium RIFCSPLOWO2_12_FULL_65_14]